MSGRVRAAAGLAAAVLAAISLAGCGSARGQVRAKVLQLVDAVARHDYRALCEQVLATTLTERIAALGATCEQALSLALAGVRQPGLAIGPIVVRRDHATVDVIATARGQEAALEAIRLIDTAAGWRVTSLGALVLPGGAATPRRHPSSRR